MKNDTAVLILDFLQKTNSTLSRTVQNQSVSTTTNNQKKPALVSGGELISQISHNRQRIAEFINWKGCHPAKTSAEYLSSLLTIAELAGFKIFPEGLFREWPYNGYGTLQFDDLIPPASIGEKLVEISMMLASAAKIADISERISIIAATEWEIAVGPIHPFYDGCGRISRYYSTLLHFWWQAPLVNRSGRNEYFEAARSGKAAFVNFYENLDVASL